MAARAHEVRIIGGKFKGRVLPVRDLEGLRPTPDRVRETVFSWLEGHVEGARVLDLFAGSGALGMESLSRGAAEVVMVEKDAANAASLKSAVVFAGDAASVMKQDALGYLEGADGKFSLVFLDPPYKSGLLKPALELLIKRNLLTDDALLYVEMNAGDTVSVPGYETVREERAGQVKYALWRKSTLLF